ncbi:GntR family transcriptional regulator [Pseudonocardia broussonetiae]|uniref:GntR family transcriptional regulator n=1 Tax=Pseudonocardia broussonetiae TaxID=2736640 RepID=A0A6M6JV55_9PSEU|nr:GntR family transcriptional regulator [Pseudonocardia broussonetiae]QJY50011.1 GntR family transcriptional regulator [Pseudonocardia broussonetiae]
MSSDPSAWSVSPAGFTGRRPTAQGLGSLVYEQIKERLLDGVLAAGQRLQVEALKAEFRVSKQPVMEALRRLSGEGLVEIIPQVGCQVRDYPHQEVEDFFRLFGGMEGTITEIAAARRTDAQIALLEQVEDQIGALRHGDDAGVRSRGYRLHNRRFHAVVHEMARSPIMAATSQRMWDLSDFLINTMGSTAPLSEALEQRHADHERIVRALRAADGATARRETEAHIIGTIGIIWPQPSIVEHNG